MAVQVVSKVLRNPLVISPLFGMLFSIAALPLPKAASNYLDLMAASVGPAALFSLGLSLIGRKLTGNMGEVIWLATLKVIINPVVTLALVTYVLLWTRSGQRRQSFSRRCPLVQTRTSLPSSTRCMSKLCRQLSSCRQVCRWSLSRSC